MACNESIHDIHPKFRKFLKRMASKKARRFKPGEPIKKGFRYIKRSTFDPWGWD